MTSVYRLTPIEGSTNLTGSNLNTVYRRWPRRGGGQEARNNPSRWRDENNFGEMSEWLKEHAWKACIG